MRTVMVHDYYRYRGGEDASYEAEVRLLQDAGHHVIPYSDHNNRAEELGALKLALQTIWSPKAYGDLRRILRTSGADILHVQNFFPLISPSAYHAARAECVPVVQTLRNYRLLCPSAIFFRDGHLCEDCLGRRLPWPGIVHSCYRGSPRATAVTAAMITVHRILRTWAELVDIYVALTEFARRKFIEGGLPAEKIVVKPNFVDPDPGVGRHTGDYALFVGRLSKEKGIATLLNAWDLIGSGVQLLIVGEGPMSEPVRQAAERLPNVTYLGRQSAERVYELMGEARALIMPSEWYETFGRVVIEAFAKGTPVIAAELGAAAELVDDGRTGVLFAPGDAADLATRVLRLWQNPQERLVMGVEARREYEVKYTADRNRDALLEVYASAITRATARRARPSR